MKKGDKGGEIGEKKFEFANHCNHLFYFVQFFI